VTRLRQTLVRTRLLGRDAVMTISVAVSALIAALPLLGWSGEQVGLSSAALVALGGVASAWLVSVDRALPLLVGLGKAVIAAVIGFGVHLSDNQVSAIMAVLTLAVSLFGTRPQVGAEQPARDRDGNDVGARPGPLINLGGHQSTRASVEHFLAEHDHPGGDEPLLPARDAPALPDRPRTDDTMAWSPHDPTTEYLPRSGQHEVSQHGAGEQAGRHHRKPWRTQREAW
jgi:hypothetical protein